MRRNRRLTTSSEGDFPIANWLFLTFCAGVNSHVASFSVHATLSCLRTVTDRACTSALRASVEQHDGSRTNGSKAFRLVHFPDVVELQTATYKVSPRLKSSRSGQDGRDTEIILTSMVHLADAGYYRQLVFDASSYDRVLFELIAEDDVCNIDGNGRRVVSEYVSPTPEQEILARNYGLAAQLNCLNYYNLCEQRLADGRSPRWVLADLRRSDIQRLQKSAKEGYTGRSALRNTLEQVTRALVIGRQAGDKILPRFFPPLGSSLNTPAMVLRAFLWLTPCPEVGIMLLDWARTYPRAGGVSAVASAIVERALSGDILTARKLGFAQQIVSSQADGGGWGLSDSVIISARNRVVVEETERALAEGCREVIILYGGLHMQDLASQLCERLGASQELMGWRAAWIIPTKCRTDDPSRRATLNSSDEEDDGEVASVTKWGPLAVAAFAYVAIGAWDWTDTVEILERGFTSSGPPVGTMTSALVTGTLYVARHAYLYYGLARWLVQWEKRLF